MQFVRVGHGEWGWGVRIREVSCFQPGELKKKTSRDRRSKLQVLKSAKMPKRRQPDSLKQLCILSIVYSFKRIWWRDYFENFGETQCMYVLGPFDALRKFSVVYC